LLTFYREEIALTDFRFSSILERRYENEGGGGTRRLLEGLDSSTCNINMQSSAAVIRSNYSRDAINNANSVAAERIR
jgi:hypothetical protein